MTVTDHIAAQADGADAQALFEEARHRRRRRYVVGVFTTLVLAAGLVLGVLLTIGSGGRVRPTGTAAAGRAGARHATVRTVTLAPTFAPEQVVAATGKIWVVGSSTPGHACAVAEVDPTSLRTRTFALPACGSYLSVGDGRIFLADGVFTLATDSDAFHIESFDTTTHRATVMAPVVVTTTGTGYAHIAMAYGAGSLWLNPWGDEVLQISASTGAVVRTITGFPVSNGGHPVMAGDGSGLWWAGGVGGPAIVDRLAPSGPTPATVFEGSEPGAVLWLSAVGGRMWAEVSVTYPQQSRVVVTQIVALDASGRKVLETDARALGPSELAVSGDQVWAVTAGPDCTGPQRLRRIDGRTGQMVVAAAWPSPVVPCPMDFSGSGLAAVGHRVFVLGPGPSPVLFRITS